jgi:hypothetical protein
MDRNLRRVNWRRPRHAGSDRVALGGLGICCKALPRGLHPIEPFAKRGVLLDELGVALLERVQSLQDQIKLIGLRHSALRNDARGHNGHTNDRFHDCPPPLRHPTQGCPTLGRGSTRVGLQP